MKHILFVIVFFVVCSCTDSTVLVYKDSWAPIDKRVDDLIGRMTLEEKVGQMNQFVSLGYIRTAPYEVYPGFTASDVEKLTQQGMIGSFLHVVTLEEASYLQTLAMKSRLQIPILFGIDAIHGNANATDNTVYPTNIGLASSFDTSMAYTIARQTAREMRAMNMHWTFNPNVEVARDPRWGRVGETYGEDPYLVSLMGAQTVKGYQGGLNSNEDVLACIKHFVGGSQPMNGANSAPIDVSERTLREVFFPPFKSGVDAGSLSLMTAHNEVNGIPCHSNEWLIKDVLRKEWGFKGFIVSDWMDIELLNTGHATADSLKEAIYQSIMAGIDMHMHGINWNENVCELVREGRISERRIDQSVRRILTIKFRLGLFEQPFADTEESMKIRLCEEHRATALEAARNSIVLLKNDSLLPISDTTYKRILITGINADDINILGDWSAAQKDENVITILEGIREIDTNSIITFVDQGWDPRNMDSTKVKEAELAATKSDLNIVVAGEYMNRERWNDRTCGENADRTDINLVGLQNDLIKRVAASGKPTILILITGRPIATEWASENLPAIINGWEPGMFGGKAIAEIIYGKVNPSAKLPITIPRNTGQIQMVYNHKPTIFEHPYVVTPSTPLYPFGYGLSYTKYEYSDFVLSSNSIDKGQTIEATVTVKNIGERDGVEIVQLYIRDRFSSVTRPVKELKDFARVSLKAGESKDIKFKITPDKLIFLDRRLKPVLEPGEFIVMVGASSLDKDLLKQSFLLNNK